MAFSSGFYRLALAGTFAAALVAQQTSPNPQLSSISPSHTAAGPTQNVTIDIFGSNFFDNAYVLFGNTSLVTTFVSSGQLQALIPANLLGNPGAIRVVVVNTITGDGTFTYASNALDFLVDSPLRIDSLEPPQALANTPDSDLYINGAGFIGGSQVLWEGTPLQTFYVNSVRILARIPADLKAVTQPTSASIQVRNPRTASAPEAFSNTLTFRIVFATLQITALNPASTRAGGAQFNLDITGQGFVSGSKVFWGKQELQTQFLSATLIRGQVTAPLIAAPTVVDITVVNPDATVSNILRFTVNAPFQISSLAPNSAVGGTQQFVLKVAGTGFVSGASILWNGSALSTTLNSATELQAAVAASLIATPGTAQVTVRLPDASVSNSLPFAINPALALISLSRTTATEGDPEFILTLNGAGFVSGSRVSFGAAQLVPGTGTATQLLVDIAASLLKAGAYPVKVTNPDGQVSNTINFTVSPPILAPTITGLSQSSAAQGSPAFTLTVDGANFTQASVVRWNSTSLATSFTSATRLTAAVPANLLTTAGTVTISVVDGPRSSNSVQFTVTAAIPSPAITGISPSSVLQGSPAFTLTIDGANFTQASAARWGATSLTTTFGSAARLSAAVPASLLMTAGAVNVSVVDGPRTSNNVQFTVTALQRVTPSLAGLQGSNAAVTIPAAAEVDLSGVVDLSFQGNAIGIPANYFDPDLKFATGGVRSQFTIAKGATQSAIPAIQLGSVAGTVTVTVSSLTGAGLSVLSGPVSSTITVARAKPSIVAGSATLTSPAAGQLLLELVGFATSREVTTVRVVFTATGATIEQGATIDVDQVAAPFRDWYNSTASQAGGSYFRLRIPFVVSQGDLTAIQNATITLTNSIGPSDPVQATRR